MKKILSIALFLILSLGLSAQLDRSQRPAAGPAPDLDFGKYKVYELDNGLKVIVVEDHKLPRITMRLLVDNDPVLEEDRAGYVSLAGDMLRQGTTTRPKDELDEEIDFIGASLFTSPSLIYTGGLSKYTEDLFEIMADVALNPAFPEDEFDKLKKQFVSGLESQKEEPDAIASNVYNALLYGKDHPYGEITTVETVEGVTLDDVKTYNNNNWIPNNAYLAVVGDIKAKDARKLAKKYFGEWAKANLARREFSDPAGRDQPQIAFTNRDASVQSVINLGNTIELQPGDPDVVPVRLVNQILGGGSLGRLYLNIREDKGYTYGAYSSFDEDRLTGEFSASASVRNEVTDSAITEFLHEFNRIRTEMVSEEELEAAKNYVIGAFGRALESPQTRGSFALNIQRYGLSEDYYADYLKQIQNVTREEVMETAKKYLQPDQILISVVGKGTEVADKLEKFGELSYYDEQANPTEPPSMEVPAGVTAQSVIEGYIAALGGAEKLKAVNDVQSMYNAEIAGAPMAIEATIARKRPDMYMMEMKAEGMGTVMKQVYDGTSAKMSGMQGEQILEGDDLEEMKNSARFNPELDYLNDKYQLELTGMSKVDDQPAYVLSITDSDGEVVTEYYSAETGLKLREETTQETPQGPMTSTSTFSDYREVNGVMYPYVIKAQTGPQSIKMTATEVKVNTGIDSGLFK